MCTMTGVGACAVAAGKKRLRSDLKKVLELAHCMIMGAAGARAPSERWGGVWSR
jgi:hypothetical protein